jgi:GntR family transcriptional regulator/MocR family aminotransferase
MWELAIQLDPDRREPRFLQLARTIVEATRRGRLRPGDPLPSTRALAAQLGLHRKTVTAAYRELASQGWISIVRARGARISRDLPEVPRARDAGEPAVRAGFELPGPAVAHSPPIPRRPGQLLLLGGVPDLASAPRRELGRVYRSTIAGATGARLLDYGDPRGDRQLRDALAEYLVRTRGLHTTPETLAIVRGSQQAIYLAARALLRPGDRVAVEALGYRPAWNALTAAGLALEPVAVDRAGLDVVALAAIHARRPLRAVYLTPHHQYPTTVTLTAARRVALLELARTRGLLVLEDDYDHEFRYDGEPVLPLAAADRHGVVCYLGTLSKIIAPGLRLGYASATPDVIARIAAYRGAIDQQGDHVLERAIAELIADGTLERHVRRARRVYRGRRDALCEALHRAIPELAFEPPHGGIALWAQAPGVDVDAWVARAYDAGVVFQPGSRFAFDGTRRDFVRLGFGACSERELADAARRMAQALPRRRR